MDERLYVQAANKCAETDSSGEEGGAEQQMCLGFELSLLIGDICLIGGIYLIGGIFIFWAEEMLRLLLLVFRKFMEGSKKD